MIELDFLIPPVMQVGNGNFLVDVEVTESPVIIADNGYYVKCQILRDKIVLESNSRVSRSELAISIALIEMGERVGMALDREAALKASRRDKR